MDYLFIGAYMLYKVNNMGCTVNNRRGQNNVPSYKSYDQTNNHNTNNNLNLYYYMDINNKRILQRLDVVFSDYAETLYHFNHTEEYNEIYVHNMNNLEDKVAKITNSLYKIL